MKTKSLFIAGCTAILLLATTFVACEKNPASQPVVNPTTGETYYSIVGKWVYNRETDYSGKTTVTLVFRADNTGTQTVQSSEGTEIYEMRYNYDPKTCLGDRILLIPGYDPYPEYFKLKWYGSDIFSSYIQDPDGDWDLTGTFQRQ